MKSILTLGELMLRICPEDGRRLLQTDRALLTFGGAEASVAVSLANFGCRSAFLSALPDHAVGQAAVAQLRSFGVDTDSIVRTGERMGVYFVEKGASQRPSKVIYDRKNSAFALTDVSAYDWEQAFSGVGWLHVSGITPALGETAFAVTLRALQEAKERQALVSFDLNYRKMLWSGDAAYAAMQQLMPYVDVLIGNEEDAGVMLGIRARDTDVAQGKLSSEGYAEASRRIRERYGCSIVATTMRRSYSADRNGWSGMLFDANGLYCSQTYDMQIVDRLGGGDAFAAGVIYGCMAGFDGQKTVDFAAAASCLKHSIYGDFNRVSVQEVLALMGGAASGRVQR